MATKTSRWTYRDLDFNMISHPVTGDVSTKIDVAAVQQSIKNLVMTSHYERGFNVDLGSSVKRSLFENYSPIMKHDLEEEIKRLIRDNEPRADVDSVNVGVDAHRLMVVVKFNILNDPVERDITITLKREG